MKFNLNGYEVEIKAKRTWMGNGRYNKADTMSFMNELAIYLGDYADYVYKDETQAKYNYVRGEICKEMGNAIYNTLEENGCYKDI